MHGPHSLVRVRAVHSCISWFWSESWFVVCVIRICDLCFLETPVRTKGLAAVLRFCTFYVEKVIKQLYFSKISCYCIYSTIRNQYQTGYCKLSKSRILISQSAFLYQSKVWTHFTCCYSELLISQIFWDQKICFQISVD